MDPAWIAVSFLFGFAVSQVGLPPLIGFLVAGFVLNLFGVEGGAVLEEVADLGVMLLLFTIGLKLRIRDLLKPETWAGASIHMLIAVSLFSASILGLSGLGLSVFGGFDVRQALLIAFTLSFSSTVFAEHMVTGQVKGTTLTLFVASDDQKAKEHVLNLGRDIGFDAVDTGPFKNARWLESLRSLNIQLGYKQKMGPQIGLKLVH